MAVEDRLDGETVAALRALTPPKGDPALAAVASTSTTRARARRPGRAPVSRAAKVRPPLQVRLVLSNQSRSRVSLVGDVRFAGRLTRDVLRACACGKKRGRRCVVRVTNKKTVVAELRCAPARAAFISTLSGEVPHVGMQAAALLATWPLPASGPARLRERPAVVRQVDPAVIARLSRRLLPPGPPQEPRTFAGGFWHDTRTTEE